MEIGIIGTGDMGKLAAKGFARAGFTVNCCDLPARREQLERELAGPNINILDDGISVSRRSDIILYLVETENIEKVAAHYGPFTKKGAIVSSGTSVMSPAIRAFERHLPPDVNIINWHWLFGPSLKPQGQCTVVVNHKSSPEVYKNTLHVFQTLEAKIIEMPSYEEHDRVTADTQVATHLGFLAMGSGWKAMGDFPWEDPRYVSGIDNVKILMCLRIYSGKAHIYSGLVTLNPFAIGQTIQYARSVSELFGLMIQEDEKRFRGRIEEGIRHVFGDSSSPILLNEGTMGEFGFGLSPHRRKPNSHLSLFGMLDTWHSLGINPYNNLICQTPPYRLRLGIVEYLCKNPALLEESIQASLRDKSIRRDDLEFHTAVREWSTIIRNRDVAGYHANFDSTKEFFRGRLQEGVARSNELLEKLVRREEPVKEKRNCLAV